MGVALIEGDWCNVALNIQVGPSGYWKIDLDITERYQSLGRRIPLTSGGPSDRVTAPQLEEIMAHIAAHVEWAIRHIEEPF